MDMQVAIEYDDLQREPRRGTVTTLAHTRDPTVAPSSIPIPSSGSVSPTVVASVPGSPPDESLSALLSEISDPSAFVVASTDGNVISSALDLGFRVVDSRKRRRIDADYLIDVAPPRPVKLPRQSHPAPDHDLMRYNGFQPGPSASNGQDHPTNGHDPVVRPVWNTLYKDSHHDREQVMRTILQTLRDVGYMESAAMLELESGYHLESADVAQLRHSVKTGLWDEAAGLLRRLGVSLDNERAARFLVSQQKYLEQLEAMQPTAALQTLRGELAVYCSDPERLHHLSSLIMCANGADVMERAKWDGARGTSRDRLLAELQRLISPSIMLPPRRLDTLLTHAKAHQQSTCTYHQPGNQSDSFSLYVDHSCTRAQFPTLTTHILAEHFDEVWRLEWSHDGRYLASASQDKTAIIWKIGDLQPGADPTTRECVAERVLSGHDYPVNALAWSPDDKTLLTSSEQVIKMWDVASGTFLRDLQNDSNSDMISGLVWLPDGSGFVSGSMDCHIVVWSTNGQKLYELGSTPDKPLTIRVTDLTITPDGARLIAAGTSAQIPSPTQNFDPSRQTRSMKVFNLETRAELFSVGLSNEVTSVKATTDSRYVLVSHAPDEVQIWDLNTQRMCQKYTGHFQGKHVIRSCLGGADESFVLSGSEDQNIFIWRRDTGALLEVLSGHGPGCVNDVAWNPREPTLFASCSDDHTIRLWCPPPPGLVVADSQERHSR